MAHTMRGSVGCTRDSHGGLEAMIVATNTHQESIDARVGRLFLNGREVGHVSIRGHDGSWGFGEFTPGPEFAAFANIFGRWSLLMHADDDRLSEAAADELRATEYEIDAIRAKILLEP